MENFQSAIHILAPPMTHFMQKSPQSLYLRKSFTGLKNIRQTPHFRILYSATNKPMGNLLHWEKAKMNGGHLHEIECGQLTGHRTNGSVSQRGSVVGRVSRRLG